MKDVMPQNLCQGRRAEHSLSTDSNSYSYLEIGEIIYEQSMKL